MLKKFTIVVTIIFAVVFIACDNGNDLCKDCTKNPCECVPNPYHGKWVDEYAPDTHFLTINTNANTIRLTSEGDHNPCWLQFSGFTWTNSMENNANNTEIKAAYPTGYRLSGTITGCQGGNSCIGNDGYFDVFLHTDYQSILLLWSISSWVVFNKQ